MKKIFIFKNKNLIISILYLTLIVGFLLNENSSGGAEQDYNYTEKFIIAISKDILNGINYAATEHPQHFPLHYILLGLSLKILKELYLVKFFFLHISIIIPLVFYKSIKLIYKNKEVAFLLSIILFISPYYRSSAIWATTDNLATLFFLLTIYFFLKFKFDKKKILYIYLSIIFIFLSFYTRPFYILFSIFFFVNIYKEKLFMKNYKKIFLLIIGCILPFAIYYNYYYSKTDTTLLTNYSSKNPINNLYILISIILFYLFPFLIFSKKNSNLFYLFFKKNLFNNCIVIFLLLFLSYKFDYHLNLYKGSIGGGIVYKFFSLYLDLNFFFIFTSFFSIVIIFFFRENIINNSIIFLTIFLCYYVEIPFQKYFDPLLIITFLTLYKSKFINHQIVNIKNNVTSYYSYFLIFYFISIVHNQ
jgi:hypothetical protein